MKELHAVGYARISIEDQSQNSLPGQQDRIKAYCTRNNLTLHKLFTENGQSAFNFNRKEWKELETYLKDHKQITYLVIDSMDRFSRADLVDALAKMNDIQKRLGVKILTVADPITLDTEDFGTDLRRIMELMFSNYELKKIRKRTSDGLYQAMASGRWVNKAPTGYINQRDSDGKPGIVIDEEKAYLIRLVFRSYLGGMELEEIKKQASANGLKLQGNSAMRRILSNPLYAGMIQLPKNGNNPARLIKALHAPIVTENDFWLVQDRLNNKTRATQKNDAVWLKGALHCECGQRMSTDKAKGKSGKYYSYYLCKVHRKNFSAVKMHAQMEDILQIISLPADSIIRITERLNELIEEKTMNKGGDLMRAKLNLQKINDKISATQERFLLQPDISEKVYNKVMSELKADEHRMLHQIAELSQNTRNYHSMASELLPKLSNLKNVFTEMPLERKTAFLQLVFGKFLYYKDGSFRTPYLHPLFSHNTLELKQRGLLLVEQPSSNLGNIPGSSPYGSWAEHLEDLWDLLVA